MPKVYYCDICKEVIPVTDLITVSIKSEAVESSTSHYHEDCYVVNFIDEDEMYKKKKTRVTLTQGILFEMKKLSDDGYGISDIARLLDLNEGTVRNNLKRMLGDEYSKRYRVYRKSEE